MCAKINYRCSRPWSLKGVILVSILNNLKGDPLEIQHPKFEISRLGFVDSVHEK